MKNFLIILFGPTAVGKTDISIEIAKYYNSEIFSCDSRQFYKELEIGVAKPSTQQLQTIRHHFINNVSIHDHYSISQYEVEANIKLEEYYKKNNIAIMCGGSGLYIDAVCNGIDEMPNHDPILRQEIIDFYEKKGIEALRIELKRIDPDYYFQVDLKNPQRIMRAIEVFILTGIPFSEIRTNNKIKRNFEIINIGLNIERNLLSNRINKRVDLMIEAGLIDEAKELYKYKNLIPLKTIGYREIFDYFDKKNTLSQSIEKIKINTRRYAKRQLTWFNKYPQTNWFEPKNKNEILNKVNQIIN
ncbi:MAG: tRNA (adenosine(37)-N6)-dimethylallyltransferase MiaA [Bacteroidales bacterium]|nr:tRNA (adenosine(37)-N6)-dimethylallyltransferase MiaA [Bacteroidales bacterium]